MACDCGDKMDAKLAEHNTRLCAIFSFGKDGAPGFVLPKIQTEKVDTKKRVGPGLAIPTFCPFCGVRYSEPTS